MLTLLPTASISFNNAAVQREGWAVFDGGPDPEGRPMLQLQREDAPEDGEPPFASDRDAREFVVARARAGPPRIGRRSTRWTTPNACRSRPRAALGSASSARPSRSFHHTRILRRIGLGLLDLSDRRWRESYDARQHSWESADKAIADEAAEVGCKL